LLTACCQQTCPDDGQRNCPKHAEFYSKNKFEKLVALIGFITRMNCDILRQETLQWFFKPERLLFFVSFFKETSN